MNSLAFLQATAADWTNVVLATATLVVTICLALSAAKIAKSANSIGRMGVRYQTLVQLRLEYRSAQMLGAIRTLTSWRRLGTKDANAVRKEFVAIFREDEKQTDPEKIEKTIDYSRRFVSQFFAMVADICQDDESILEASVLSLWGESTVRLLNDTVIPMEFAVQDALGLPAERVHKLTWLAKRLEEQLRSRRKE